MRSPKRRKPKFTDPIDPNIGHNILLVRSIRGMHRKDLGAAIGVSLQQITKYEVGHDRISTGRLAKIADALGTEPGFFFRKPDEATATGPVVEFMTSVDGKQLNRAFSQISDQPTRQAILTLLHRLAESARMK